MVIRKPNRKYFRKTANAVVVDLLKLQNQHPERMDKVIKTAKEYKWPHDRICLLKVWEDWYVYGLYIGERLKQKAILVNSKLDFQIGKLFQVEGQYFTIYEVDAWRGEVLAELLRIQHESPCITNEQIAKEISFLNTNVVLHTISAGNIDWKEDARVYADLVTR
jgi:hypothetical protein